MELPKEDRLFIAYMSSFLHGDEYGDAFLENDNRDDLYWSLGSIRRHSFSFFSVKGKRKIFPRLAKNHL